MTRKSSLYLIELCVMILVFAIASVFCIRMFGYARQESLLLEARDRALIEAQNAAELVKACGGDFDRTAALRGGHVDETGVWTLRWNAAWEPVEEDPAYTLQVYPLAERLAGLGEAELRVSDSAGRLLCVLPVSWQKEGA